MYAHAGMERQLARQQVTLAPGGSAQVSFALAPITGLFPTGALTGDFHVHGGRSFDTAFPDRERVMSFVIAGVQVIAATDHDVTTSYQETIAALNVGARVRVMAGVEATQLIPWMHVPGSSFPKDIGHFNFWPLTYDTTRSHNGAPWDELIEPGQLFDIMRREVGATGVMQLNHPTAESKIGRDEGYLRAIGYDPRHALPGRDDGTGPGRLYARPNGAQHRNVDYDVQEAMNGADLLENLQYRGVWHQFLSQGVLRAGTANSDSHSMRIGPMGYPRNVVLAGFGLADFNVDAFNTAVRDGRMVGTNGPVVTARLHDGDARADPRAPGDAERGGRDRGRGALAAVGAPSPRCASW